MPLEGQQDTGIDLATARLISIPTMADDRGKLTIIAAEETVPFSIRRVFYVYNTPGDASRGGHAHKTTQQFVVPIAGAFTVTVESQDGTMFRERLDKPDQGLYIPALHWNLFEDYSPGSVCLVLASGPYDPHELLRDHAAFKSYRAAGQ